MEREEAAKDCLEIKVLKPEMRREDSSHAIPYHPEGPTRRATPRLPRPYGRVKATKAESSRIGQVLKFVCPDIPRSRIIPGNRRLKRVQQPDARETARAHPSYWGTRGDEAVRVGD